MTELSYEKIRDIQRRERKEASLAAINSDFYPSLAALVKTMEKQYTENPDTEKLREKENMLKLAKQLFDQREQKILLKAMRAIRAGRKLDENLTPEEKKFYDTLTKALENNRDMFEKTIHGQQITKKMPKTLLNETAHKVVLVRVLKEIPCFVGSDSTEYGPYKQNSMVKLPEKEAELMLKRNLVEKM
ncbi:hypothetical protein K8R43_01440 [archaeon]|nr:hypothetical protein [archaeon]